MNAGTDQGWAVSTSNPPFPCRKWRPSPKYRHSSGGRAAMSDRNFNWQTLCEAAIIETNPDKLAICIGAAEQAIAQRESLVDTTELERHKLADARSMLKSLSRIASSQGKHAAYEAAQPTQQRLD